MARQCLWPVFSWRAQGHRGHYSFRLQQFRQHTLCLETQQPKSLHETASGYRPRGMSAKDNMIVDFDGYKSKQGCQYAPRSGSVSNA